MTVSNLIATDLRGSILNSLVITCITPCDLWTWINTHPAYPNFDRRVFDAELAELIEAGLVYEQRMVPDCRLCGRSEMGVALTDLGYEVQRDSDPRNPSEDRP